MDQIDDNEMLAANIHGLIRQFYPFLANIVTPAALDRYLPAFRNHLEARGWLIVRATIPPIAMPMWPECEVCGAVAVSAVLVERSPRNGNGEREPLTFYYCAQHGIK